MGRGRRSLSMRPEAVSILNSEFALGPPRTRRYLPFEEAAGRSVRSPQA
jgi:hypothetical protein